MLKRTGKVCAKTDLGSNAAETGSGLGAEDTSYKRLDFEVHKDIEDMDKVGSLQENEGSLDAVGIAGILTFVGGKCKIQECQMKAGQKNSTRNLKNEISPSSQQPERSNSDSLPDSSTSGSEYRVLRQKYLLLEEESFALGGELRETEDEVKTLEEEKLALLDQLVVLEGLLDPSELH
ncbi:hypothetical protein FH972_000559 [Carpinus fangiana]|uniref:Uncharacterized protein n=1 Tax=Carpinus fangiana TaxID=176857 RepID=A0A5N6QBG3_9ROSI|nr:hypothetical protein FH972_000559 [Carpinus fangiana]